MTTKRAFPKGLSAALLLITALALPAMSTAQQNRRHSWDDWNRRYSRYGNGAFQLEGTLIGQQYGCALVQDRRGQVIPLVSNPGDLRKGTALLLSGRIENSTVCGTAFRVASVDRIWADASRRIVLFDRRTDGDYYSGGYRNRYGNDRDRNDRYGRNDSGYDNRYDRDRDDRGENRNLISLVGRLDDSGRCPVIRGDHGEYYDLVGELRDFRDGDHARVVGFLGARSSCGGQAIDVQEID